MRLITNTSYRVKNIVLCPTYLKFLHIFSHHWYCTRCLVFAWVGCDMKDLELKMTTCLGTRFPDEA